jgi:hypothetical protein
MTEKNTVIVQVYWTKIIIIEIKNNQTAYYQLFGFSYTLDVFN